MNVKLIACIALVLFYSSCKFDTSSKNVLPIYGNREPVTKTVNGKTVTDTVYQTIPDFKFVNQYGDTVTSKSLDGNIYVADFFFTSCPSICPIMHRNMLNVYNDFKSAGDFKIISHSIDPVHDDPATLKKYAGKLGVEGNTWWFLTGKKEDIYQIAQKSYLVQRPSEDEKQQFIHDGLFILVDKQKRVRGSYDGTDPKQVDQLIADIKTLRSDPTQTIAQ